MSSEWSASSVELECGALTRVNFPSDLCRSTTIYNATEEVLRRDWSRGTSAVEQLLRSR